jgi:hypothetical protein
MASDKETYTVVKWDGRNESVRQLRLDLGTRAKQHGLGKMFKAADTAAIKSMRDTESRLGQGYNSGGTSAIAPSRLQSAVKPSQKEDSTDDEDSDGALKSARRARGPRSLDLKPKAKEKAKSSGSKEKADKPSTPGKKIEVLSPGGDDEKSEDDSDAELMEVLRLRRKLKLLGVKLGSDDSDKKEKDEAKLIGIVTEAVPKNHPARRLVQRAKSLEQALTTLYRNHMPKGYELVKQLRRELAEVRLPPSGNVESFITELEDYLEQLGELKAEFSEEDLLGHLMDGLNNNFWKAQKPHIRCGIRTFGWSLQDVEDEVLNIYYENIDDATVTPRQKRPEAAYNATERGNRSRGRGDRGGPRVRGGGRGRGDKGDKGDGAEKGAKGRARGRGMRGAHGNRPRGGASQAKGAPREQPGQLFQRGSCFRCGQMGHTFANCTNAMVCRTCLGKHHSHRNCEATDDDLKRMGLIPSKQRRESANHTSEYDGEDEGTEEAKESADQEEEEEQHHLQEYYECDDDDNGECWNLQESWDIQQITPDLIIVLSALLLIILPVITPVLTAYGSQSTVICPP